MKPALQWARELHELVRYADFELAVLALRQEMATECAEIAKAHECSTTFESPCPCAEAIGAEIALLRGGARQ